MAPFFGGISLIWITICIIVVILAVGREMICWYIKVNERIELEKECNTKIDEVAGYLKLLIQIELEKKKERDKDNEFELTK